MSGNPLVTVLVPARNEEAEIEGCLAAVLAQSWPLDRLEVIVVDGGSSDATVAVAKGVLAGADLHGWQVIDNATGTTPSNLNRGLAAASGDVLCRVDARCRIPADYVSCCVELLGGRPEVAVTGGAQVASARRADPRSIGIARALNNRWGMGGSRYRRGAASGPADTVYLGAFRTADLRAVSGWDERYHTNQDFELNRRMASRGIVWFDSRLSVSYLPRVTVREVWQQYRRFGVWKVRYWRASGDPPQRRQLVLLVAPPLGAASLAAWTLRRPARRLPLAAAAALGTLVTVDAAGSSGPPGDPTARVVAGLTTAAIGLGWWSGVVQTMVRGGAEASLPPPDDR